MNETHTSSFMLSLCRPTLFYHSNPWNCFQRIIESKLLSCMILIWCRWGKPIAVLLQVSWNKQHRRRSRQKQTPTNRAASWRRGAQSWAEFWIQQRRKYQETQDVRIRKRGQKRWEGKQRVDCTTKKFHMMLQSMWCWKPPAIKAIPPLLV